MTSEKSEDRNAVFTKEAMPYLDAMYAVALRLTSNEKEAEDLVQDALLRAYRFFDKFQPGTNLKAWLLKVETNVFLNRVKRVNSRPTLVDFETLEDVLGDADAGRESVPTSSEFFRELLDDDVARALDELPLEYRTPVLLSAVEGLSYKEIADAMECPVGTVMSRLYRGRKMLERSLKTYAESIGFLKGRKAL